MKPSLDTQPIEDENQEKKGLNAFEGSLAVLSTVIGGGIVGIPWAMAQMGIPLGIIVNAIVTLATQFSCYLYLQARNNIPVSLNSIYEVSYICMGRAGIFIVSAVQFGNALGLDIIYFIVFGDATGSIVYGLSKNKQKNFWTSRVPWILILAGCLVYPLLQKEMKELRIVSITLFVAIGLFILLMIVQLEVDGAALNPDLDHSIYYHTSWELPTLSALGIIMTAYGF